MPGFAPNDVQFYDYAPHTMYYPVELYCGKPVQIPEEKEPKAVSFDSRSIRYIRCVLYWS